jgi:hypothetical protein
MYNYSFTENDGAIKIITPKVNSLKDVKIETKQTNECIINHSIYPNGLDITMTQLANKILISANHKLVKNDDGSFIFEN